MAETPDKPLRQISIAGRGLVIERGGRLVLSGVDFALEPGKALLLRGANGVGKSTLLRGIAGLLPLKSGALAWHDGPVEDDPLLHASRLNYLGHQDPVKPMLTVEENLAFFAGPSHRNKVEPALEYFGLSRLRNLAGRYLSAGQKRRLSLARLIARPSLLWLLDEPAAALDAEGVEVLSFVLRSHLTHGGMVILSAHSEFDLPEASLLRLNAPSSHHDEAAGW